MILSLQLNLGIIAACAPTLKPLVGHALKLSSRDKYYGEYYGNNQSHQSRQSRGTALRSARMSRPDHTFDDMEFELSNRPYGNKSNRLETTVEGGADSDGIFEKGQQLSRSDSEERILQGDPKGIVRTTEIEIRS